MRETDRAQVGEGQRERGTEDPKDSTEPHTGLESTNCEIMTQAKVGCLTD